MSTRPEIPTQDGWAVEMHGECVLFCNNAEKAAGQSPGARVRVFSEAKLRKYADACAASQIARLQAQVDALALALRKIATIGNEDGLSRDEYQQRLIASAGYARVALAAVGRWPESPKP